MKYKKIFPVAVLLFFSGGTLLFSDGAAALRSLQQGNHAAAVRQARQALRTNSKDLVAWRALSGGLYRLRRYAELQKTVPEAIKDYRINLNTGSNHAFMILKYLGAACLNSGNSKKAIVAFGIAAKIKSDDPDLYNSLGLSYLKTGAYVLSEVSFQTAVALQPGNHFYHNNLGAAYLEQNRLKAALAKFEKSVRITYNYINGWDNVWATRRKLGYKSNRGWKSYSYFLFDKDEKWLGKAGDNQQQKNEHKKTQPAKVQKPAKRAQKQNAGTDKDRNQVVSSSSSKQVSSSQQKSASSSQDKQVSSLRAKTSSSAAASRTVKSSVAAVSSQSASVPQKPVNNSNTTD